jgi:hypothetical protein
LALSQSDATRRRANVRRNPAVSPVISFSPRLPRPPPTRELQQPVFLRRIRKLLTSSRSSAAPPTQDDQSHGVCPFNLFFSSSPSSFLQETVPRSQPQLEHVGLPRGFFDDVGRRCYQFTPPLTAYSVRNYLPAAPSCERGFTTSTARGNTSTPLPSSASFLS